jgi:uncharacterized membrane protein YeiH
MPPNLDVPMDWVGLSAVALMAAAGVLEAGRTRFDLFGMIVVALAAALASGFFIFALRLAAIRRDIQLPRFSGTGY